MKRLLMFLPLLLFALWMNASTTKVKINLWSGTQATGSWTGYQVISASSASQVAAGDQILVTVSSIDGSNAMLMLNNGSWATLTGTSAVSLTAPTTVSIDVTEAMATEIKSGGFIVKGCNYTFTSVDLNHQLTTVDGSGKGNASTVLWSGSQKINWTADATGKTHSQKIDKSKFANAAAGMTLRLYYNNVGSGLYLPNGKYAKGVVTPKSGSTNLAGKNVYLATGSSYTDLTLTSDMVSALQTNGLSIIGDYFTLTSVNLIDPNKTYSTFCQINKKDIKAWEKGETPKLSMTITNLQNTAITIPYCVNLFPVMEDPTTHTFPLLKTYKTTVSLAASETKTVDLSFSDLTTPGFYRMVALVDSSDICAYNIGYDPTEIGCKNDAQADFWTYWDKAKAQLASVPMNATLKELTDYSSSARKVYEVTLQSVPDDGGTTPMTIKGWYAEPTAKGKYPTLVQFQGTDGGKSTVTCPLKGDDNPGWVQFVLSTRGQMQCRDDKYGYDFYSYCWGDTAKHYYRNAYLDCARAVDFVKSRDCVNQKQIFATGGSQGGCFTYVAEALTQAFRAIAPSITGHADFQHGMEIVNWPRAKFLIAQKNLGWTDAQRDAFNSYYDTKNFTDRVTCPVISCFSLQDTTDPSHTNIAPYNLLTTQDKEYIINPFLGHATPSEWPTRYFAFFQKYIDADNASKPVQTVWTGSKKIDWSDKTGNYWQNVPASAFSGVKEGMKIRVNYTNLAIGAQGHICKASDWSNFDGDAAKYLSLSSSYFEFPVTAAMATELKNNGCIVTGIGYTLTSVDLINTANIPNIACSVDSATIKCWEKGENPHIDVVLENKTSEAQSTSVKLSLRTDKYVAMEGSSQEVSLNANEKKTVSFPLTLDPGFYHAIVEANYSAIADFNIGYDPTEMSITPDAQSDFKAYWDNAKAQLAKVAPEYKLTKIESKSTSKRNVYLVEMQSIDNGDGKPVTIRGYYAEPVAEGTYPAIIMQNGYDAGTYDPYIPNGDGDPDVIELTMSNRGQLINNRAPYKDENSFYGDWFQYNFGDTANYYYRGAYMDVIRSIDFIASRAKVQKENIFMTGTSQGGAFTIAGAALDDRLNAIAPGIQFMGDFPEYFQVGAWPRSRALEQQKTKNLSDEDMYKFLSYYDTKDLAPYVTCPVYTVMGLQDPVCPPRTNFAPYINFASTEKSYKVNSFCQHDPGTTWYTEYMAFFKSHLKPTSTGINNTVVSTKQDSKTYNLAGQQVSSQCKGLVIIDGKKQINK